MAVKRILQPGRNCWQIEKADKVAFLVDGADYFKALFHALPQAEQQIIILSWDIYSQLNLILPEDENKQGLPTCLGDLLDYLVKQKPNLFVNILSWDFSLLFALSREWLPIYKLDWKTRRRLRLCFDDQYPFGASHHQKVVVIDDALAFVGGLDLTRGRWDTSEHQADDPRRKTIDGTMLPITPHHDVQLAVSGPIATALGDMGRERWRRGTTKRLPAPEPTERSIWPTGLAADIENVDVAIVRTAPSYGEHEEVREVEQLYIDAINAAQDYIYIENQFFTAPVVADALAKRLAAADGPEVVVNLPLKTEGWLSQNSMDVMRIELIRKLCKADRHDRFNAYYLDKSHMPEKSINLHAKVMIIDDRFVRVGSANLNNRSMGLDTECDLAIEADESQPQVCAAIQQFRNRLLSEHLDCRIDEVAAQVSAQGSLLKAIEALRGKERTLSPLEPTFCDPDPATLQEIQITDPEHPLDSSAVINHFVPETHVEPAGKRIVGWVIALLAMVGAALAWRFTPLGDWLAIDSLVAMVEQWRESVWAPALMVLGFVLAGFVVIPVTALIIVSVLVFGPYIGFIYALLGAFSSAIASYGVGVLLGRKVVRKLAGKRVNQISKQLAKRGLFTMLVVRIIPVAPFTIVNIVAGASHIRLRDFSLGTLLGLLPGILGIAVLTDRVANTLRTPDPATIATLVLAAILVFSMGYILSKQLLNHTSKTA